MEHKKTTKKQNKTKQKHFAHLFNQIQLISDKLSHCDGLKTVICLLER